MHISRQKKIFNVHIPKGELPHKQWNSTCKKEIHHLSAKTLTIVRVTIVGRLEFRSAFRFGKSEFAVW